MSKKPSKVLSVFLALVMVLGIIVAGGPAVAVQAAGDGLSLAEFSGHKGEWGKVASDSTSARDTLKSIKAFQQDGYLYISVEAEADSFGPNPIVYIDNGSTGTKFQVTAWTAPTTAAPNNRISHKIEGGKLYKWLSGTTWEEVTGSAMVSASGSAGDFREYRISLTELGVTNVATDRRIMRVGYFNGLNFYRPNSGLPMLVVDPPLMPLDANNMPTITLDGDPAEWLAQGLTPLASGRKPDGQNRYGMFGGDMYGFRDGDWMYLLYFGNDNTTTGRTFDTRDAVYDAQTCIVLNTDGNPNTGYTPTFTTMYAAAGADYEIHGTTLGKATGTGYDWIDLGSLVADPAQYTEGDAFIRAYGTGPFTDFGAGANYTHCCEVAINLAKIAELGGEPMAEIIKAGIFIDGAAYVPDNNATYAAIPCVVDYTFSMTGNKADWSAIEAVSKSDPADYSLQITTDGDKLYTMVSGSNLNTQNVYFVDTGAGGYTRHGRPGVDYLVANGYLYRVTGNNSSATPEYVQNATLLSRVYMEYWPDNIVMQLRLDQIGNPDPAAVKISYFGKSAIDLPARTDSFLALTASFERLREADIYYPVEDYTKLNNPFMGWAQTISNNLNPKQPVRMSYQEVRWNNLEPAEGQYTFATLNVANFTLWKNAGNSVNLRFQMDNPGTAGHMDIPQWLYDKMEAYRDANGQPVSPGKFYNSNGVGAGFAPNYNHPVLIEYHQKAIQAIADEIANPDSPWSVVGNIQIGSLGHWGEFHNWPEEDSGAFPNLSVSNQYVQHYIDAFADNDNIQLGIRYATPIAAQNNMGLFNDLIGLDGDTRAWVSWFTDGRSETYRYDDSGRTLEQYLAAAKMPDFWKTAYSGGEYGNGGDPNDGSIMAALNQLRLSHTTWIGPHTSAGVGGTNNAANQTAQKNADAMIDVMGYKFVIEQFVVDAEDTLLPGDTVKVAMTVNNKGVAPFYRQWPLEISLIDEDGAVAYSWQVEDLDIRQWLPGRNAVDIEMALPQLAPGAYKLAVAILDTRTEAANPGIDFAIMGRRTDGRYLMEQSIAVTTKAGLQSLYDSLTAEARHEALYTTSSWARFTAAMAEAGRVLAADNATAAEVIAAYAELDEAENLVLRASKLEQAWLAFLLGQYQDYEQSAFTPESWAPFAQALAAAKAIDPNDSTDAQAKAASDALLAAAGALVPVSSLPDNYLLQLYIDIANELLADADKLTPQSVAMLQNALSGAEAALNSNVQAVIKAASDALLSAINNTQLKGDKSLLERIVTLARTYRQDTYTAASWEPFANALNMAEVVLANPNATVSDVDFAVTSLSAAMGNLVVKANFASLKTAIEQAEKILAEADKYVASTLVGLQEKLDAAKLVYANPNASQTEVNAATAALAAANAKARLKVDLSALQAMLTSVRRMNLSLYTAASVQAVENVMTRAAALTEDNTLDEVNAVLQELKDSIDALQLKATGTTTNTPPATVVTLAGTTQTAAKTGGNAATGGRTGTTVAGADNNTATAGNSPAGGNTQPTADTPAQQYVPETDNAPVERLPSNPTPQAAAQNSQAVNIWFVLFVVMATALIGFVVFHFVSKRAKKEK